MPPLASNPQRGIFNPSLWRRTFAREEGRNGDQHDANCIAAWLSYADRDATFLKPDLPPP